MRTRQILQILGIGIGNTAAVTHFISTNKTHESFKQMPRDQQRKIYDGCPLNKVGSSGDGIAAIQERMMLDNQSLRKIPPSIPFDEAYPMTRSK